ncbi:SusC/RagA family TonB-linked outer membrane protein [Pseudobacter ginsenosidimutans]|nr:SusC/RagA family TonB-linked outer membrane protein [Pseudobacter ginsenosidimutans]
MKLTVVLMTAVSLTVSATGISQKVTLSAKNATLPAIFATVQKQTGFVFLYTDDVLQNVKPVTFQVKDLPLEQFLKELFRDQPIDFTLSVKSVFLSRKATGPPAGITPNASSLLPEIQRLDITGLVLDNNMNPLPGVSVTIKGTQAGTATDQKGEFTFRDIDPNAVLIFSYVGFKKYQENVNGRTRIMIRMMQEDKTLDDAVVYNGYQKIKQKYLTGSVSSVKMDSIMQPGFNTVDKMLEGRIPGLTYMQNSGQSGAAPKLRIRGTSTVLGSREPLWVVDGIIRTNPIPIPADRINDPDFVNLLGNAISGLNPYDIDQIDVLKDATAAALYGVRAANGVIVITTKRGKPGPPVVNYNVTGSFTQRPRYTDRSMYMMNSRERIDVSREMIDKKIPIRGVALEAYEKAMLDYSEGRIDYNTFKKLVDRAETINTDWLGNTMQDQFATTHTLSVSGGTASASYRVSFGYQNEPGVIKKETNDRYTGSANLLLSYGKLKADLSFEINKGKRRYTPSEIGLLNYAYGASRAIPLYNEDGSLYYYSTLSSSTSISARNYDLRSMNIVNEMDHTGELVENSEYIARANLVYEIAKGIQWNSTLAYTGGNADHQTWFEENTEWAAQVKYNAYKPLEGIFDDKLNVMPFGGQLRQQTTRRQNYTVNSRISFYRSLDRRNLHQLNADAGIELISNNTHSFDLTSRGYYPGRGYSFAIVDPVKYPAFASWMSQNGNGTITKGKQNSLRSFLVASYIFNDRFIFSATTSQEYSNAFGSRSNEKFLPTWALSGRWNMHEDLLRRQSWIDLAALTFSFGVQGNMPDDQSTPYTVIKRGSVDPYYLTNGSNIISFPNPGLGWEKKYDYNGSLRFSILQSRVSGTLSYFYNKTTNAFLSKKVSGITGISNYVVNGGVLENKGVEIALQFRVIDNMGKGNKRGFIWRIDPQMSQVFNTLLNNNVNSRNVMADAATINYEDYLNGRVPVNGKSINTFYSYRFKSLDHQYGYPIFYGAEPEKAAELFARYQKMTKDQVLEMVMVESGRREPVIQAGINNSFVYRNWMLDITFTYSIGNKVRLLQIASGKYGTFRPGSQQNLRKEFVNRWRSPGDEVYTNIPAIQGKKLNDASGQVPWWGMAPYLNAVNNFASDYYQMYDNSDLRVVSGDYLKLQNISLAYMFNKELCQKWSIKGATVRLTGNNLFTIANKALRGQDPSQSGSAPNINLSIRPVYALNINLSF